MAFPHRQLVNPVRLDGVCDVEWRPRPLDLRVSNVEKRLESGLIVSISVGKDFREGVVTLETQARSDAPPHVELQGIVTGVAVVRDGVRSKRVLVAEERDR